MMEVKLLLVIACAVTLSLAVPRDVYSQKHPISSNNDYFRVCYYTNWAQYRPSYIDLKNAKFFPEDIDASLCSHFIYAFASMNDNHELADYEWNDIEMWGRFNQHVKSTSNAKTLIAVGGWNFGTERMTAMMETAATRKPFIDSSMALLREYNFDGLDLDFEYPGNRGSPADDKHRFTILCQELRAAYEAEALVSGEPTLLLSAAVAAGQTTIDAAYDIPAICEELDFINIMAYDLNGGWDVITGHNSPLYARTNDPEPTYNVKHASEYWAGGCSKDKLVVGLPSYGRGFLLTDPGDNGIGAPTKDGSPAGRWTREKGFYAYYEICKMLNEEPGAVRKWEPEHQAPYAYINDTWVGYDDRESIRLKTNWIRDNGFGGWMFWDLDLDDFRGEFCNDGAYPLISEANDAWEGIIRPSTTTTTTTTSSTTTTAANTPTTTTPATSTTTSPSGEFTCEGKDNGYYPNMEDCEAYYQCANGVTYPWRCPEGLMYDPVHSVCNYPRDIDNDHICSIPNCPYCV